MKTMSKMHRNGSALSKRDLKSEYMTVAEQVSDTAKEVKTSATKAIQDLQEYCHENPGKAMGISAGVAALVSLSLMKILGTKQSTSEKVFTDLFHNGEQAWNHLKGLGKPAVEKIKKSVATLRD